MIKNVNDSPDCLNTIHTWWSNEWGAEWATITIESINKNQLPIIFGYFEGTELVGCTVLLENDLATRPDLIPWVGGVYVREANRGQGIASMLVDHVTNYAFGLGYETLWLYVYPPYGPCRVYSKLGWTEVEECEYDSEVVKLMKKHKCPR